MRNYFYTAIAKEISRFGLYFDSLQQLDQLPHDDGLFKSILNNFCSHTSTQPNKATHAELFVLNGNLNYSFDIQGLLTEVHGKTTRTTRVAVIQYNPYYFIVYQICSILGIRKGPTPTTFLTETDLNNLANLANFEIVKSLGICPMPVYIPIISSLVNKIISLLPLFRKFCLVNLYLLRPLHGQEKTMPSLTVVIPARNEKGNIEPALKRLPNIQGKTEVIFVEGHSQDGTWDEIQRVAPLYKDKFWNIKTLKQTGKGKSNAVEVGFANATADLLTILDADLTMPPEMLERFYNAYVDGKADFINGSRLVYPMEGEAMRPLNHLGNLFFAKSLSYVLGTNLSDSLCGTKLMSKADYLRFNRWNHDFGKFDPFGDYEMIFPATVLGLGTINLPIRYLARTYGSTNISRFRHGAMLLKMTLIGLFRIRMAKL